MTHDRVQPAGRSAPATAHPPRAGRNRSIDVVTVTRNKLTGATGREDLTTHLAATRSGVVCTVRYVSRYVTYVRWVYVKRLLLYVAYH